MAKPNYRFMKNEELESHLKSREIPIPMGEQGMNRSEAILALTESDDKMIMEAIDEKQAKELAEAVAESEDTVVITFHNQEGTNDSPYVFLGHNGKSFYLPREKELTIPRYLLGVIEDAIEPALSQRTDDKGDIVTVQRNVPRFVYTVKR